MKSRFEEFIEIDKFRKALGYVSRATGMAFSVLDPLGNVIIYPMNESDFCKEVRKDPKVAAKCVDCIVHSAINAAKASVRTFSNVNTDFWNLSCQFSSTENTFRQCAAVKCARTSTRRWIMSIRKKNSTRNCKSCSTISQCWRKTAIMPLQNSLK